MQAYLKAIFGAAVAALGAVATALSQGHGHISSQAAIAIAIAFFGSLSVVWGVPNAGSASALAAAAAVRAGGVQKYLKAFFGAAAAGLGAFATAYTQGHGHIGWQAVIAIAVTVLTALGVVWGVPNMAQEKPGGRHR